MCGILSRLTRESQCFVSSTCQWGRSGGYGCMCICSNIYLSIIYFIWCKARYTMGLTLVPSNVTRSTKLRGAQHSLELAFRMEFCLPENLTFPALLKSDARKLKRQVLLTGYELAARTSQNTKVFQVSAKLFPWETTKMQS